MWREMVRVLVLSLSQFMVIRGYCNNGTVNRGKVLRESTFKYNSHKDIYSCAASCLMHSLCKSFNFHIGQNECFLNYYNSLDTNNLEDDVDFIQSDIDSWSRTIAGPCKSNPCTEYEECSVDRFGETSCKSLKVMHVEYDKESDYILMTTRLNWTQAKSSCEVMGGHLAIVEDERENRFITIILTQFGFASSLIWFGATDAVVENSWFWIDGQPIVFEAWMLGQPNNPGNQDCAGIIAGSGWKSNPCSYDYRYLCEMNL